MPSLAFPKKPPLQRTKWAMQTAGRWTLKRAGSGRQRRESREGWNAQRRVWHGAEAVGRVDKGDSGPRGCRLVTGGIAQVQGAVDLIPAEQKLDIFRFRQPVRPGFSVSQTAGPDR